MSGLKEAEQRVAQAGRALGLEIEVRQMGRSTRTAGEAAEAIGCDVAQIVKSLIFRGKASGKPYLILVSGANRVDEAAVTPHLGEAPGRADAQFVRDVTGYAIGGIPPFGHREPFEVFLDRDLMAHEVVWAAAGTPDSMFALPAHDLQRVTGARIIPVA